MSTKTTLPDELIEFNAQFEAPIISQKHKILDSEGILVTSLTVSLAEVCMALKPMEGPDDIPDGQSGSSHLRLIKICVSTKSVH
ncbi:hypothetical protein M9458_057735 [Cirrhinus mrigala]|uniref:Uncharacterized protein n=1 Tax=Cirrhinus mrigala TaxID=683832 RepID=A0ABD0MDN3_CIRMR